MAFPQYACMDAGGRVPTVGALGDAGAVTEIYPKSDRLLESAPISRYLHPIAFIRYQ